MGAISTPDSVASTVAMTQFWAAIRFADRPISAAPTSFSAPARVASPNREYRKAAARATAATITMPARYSWLIGTTTPASTKLPVGSTDGADVGVVPKLSTAMASSESITPTDAHTLVSGAARSSGR